MHTGRKKAHYPNMTLNENLTRGRPHERGEAILDLVVAPAGAGKFTDRLDGRDLCASTKPFLDAARVLLAEGADPATALEMRHAGSAMPAAPRSRCGRRSATQPA
jgi:hypothetical protein